MERSELDQDLRTKVEIGVSDEISVDLSWTFLETHHSTGFPHWSPMISGTGVGGYWPARFLGCLALGNP